MYTKRVHQRFQDRVAVITGSASGIGREVARRFAGEGARVVVADVDEAGSQETARLIAEAGGECDVVATDVSDPGAVQHLMDSTMTRHGRIDVLHNNAFWAPLWRPLADTTVEEWERTMAVSLTGVFLGCKYVLPHMVAAGSGVIINTASVAAFNANPLYAAYMTAKGGVVSLTKSVAWDYGKQGVRCVAIAPGLIEGTGVTLEVFENPERVALLKSKLALDHAGVPEDIAHAVLYAASDEARFMTGSTLVVDGGRMLV
jgi:NAD(P)-dependent dehydrogenase (short-subunit alcohol dehydrogenase family)